LRAISSRAAWPGRGPVISLNFGELAQMLVRKYFESAIVRKCQQFSALKIYHLFQGPTKMSTIVNNSLDRILDISCANFRRRTDGLVKYLKYYFIFTVSASPRRTPPALVDV
jgi:hypothetical protein